MRQISPECVRIIFLEEAIRPPSVPTVYEFDFIDKNQKLKHTLCTVGVIPGTGQSIASIMDITERKRAEERARFLGYHDSLTGLPNRMYFETVLECYNNPEKLPYTVIIGDVNGLKLVNDAFGHQEGDELLQDIAAILVKACRRTRYRGSLGVGMSLSFSVPAMSKVMLRNLRRILGRPVPVHHRVVHLD